LSEIIAADQAARIMRSALRDAMSRYFSYYLAQGTLLMLAGLAAMLFPAFSSLAIIYFLGWLFVVSAAFQAISLVGARHAPHFLLQLVATSLALAVGFLLIRNPGLGLVAMSFLLIVYFFVGGMAKVAFALTIRPFPMWGLILMSGIVGMALGVFLFSQFRELAPWFLGLLVGAQLFCEGAAIALMAWRARRTAAN